MRNIMFVRIYRRIILKRFGSTKNFIIWSLAVICTIYFIDSFILTKTRLQSLAGQNVEKMEMKVASDVRTENTKQEDLRITANKPSANDPNESAKKCGLETACPQGKYAYHIKSGVERDGSPIVCFDGKYIISSDAKNSGRGINMVVIDDKTLNVEDVRTFDVYAEDTVLIRYLTLGVQGNSLILAATLDEASYHLTAESKLLMNQFGSSLIDNIKFRDNFVMIGQKGLTHGSAIEKLNPRDAGKPFGDAVEIQGCLSIPLGKINEGGTVNVNKKVESKVVDMKTLGEEKENCGVEQCAADEFPVQLFTGIENKQAPKICVNGKYVLAAGLNDAGRGLNIVVVNPKTKEVIRVGRFDTFESDSSNLEIFLEMLNDQEIIIVVAYDEASTKLSDLSKHLFNELGSALIQNVKFRDVWAFAGQKGITGFSEIEQIEFAGSGWPRPIDKRVCVPTILSGNRIKPDPLENKNNKRQVFCEKYDGYGEFCEIAHIDEQLTPAPLSDKTLENHEIFKVPIVVIPGLNYNALRMQLETLLMNPGIQTDMVLVASDGTSAEPDDLASLFNFKSLHVNKANKYIYLMHQAIVKAWELYPNAHHMIVLEEEVIPGQDFIDLMAQCIGVVESDSSLIGVSAWNENGYESVSSIPNLIYRTETFPGLGFMIKQSFYTQYLQDKLALCCTNRSWEGWLNGNLDGHEMIVPDISRVYRRPYEGLTEQAALLNELFNKPRNTHLTHSLKLKGVEKLMKEKYEEELHDVIKSSRALDTTNVEDCFTGHGLGFYVPETTGKVYSIYYEQASVNDEKILSLLCKCFKLFYVTTSRVRGKHRGLVRLSYRENEILLIGSSTVYYEDKPKDYKPVLLSQLQTKHL